MPRYLRMLCWAAPIFIGSILAYAVGNSDGMFAGSHDAYGTVAIGASRIVHLPVGRTRLYSQERKAYGNSSSGIVTSTPRGISVSVTPVDGGQPLKLRHLTGSETQHTNLGWVTYRAFYVPEAGDYRVTVSDPDHNGDAKHSITVGKGGWAPLPPPVLGGLIFALFVLIGALANAISARIFEWSAQPSSDGNGRSASSS